MAAGILWAVEAVALNAPFGTPLNNSVQLCCRMGHVDADVKFNAAIFWINLSRLAICSSET